MNLKGYSIPMHLITFWRGRNVSLLAVLTPMNVWLLMYPAHLLAAHRVGQKRTTLQRYNFHVHKQILVIFGRHVAEKIRNQMVLYFLTSSDCFYTIRQNRKSRNCIFSVKYRMLFCQLTHKNITRSQLNHYSLSKQSTLCIRQEQTV